MPRSPLLSRLFFSAALAAALSAQPPVGIFTAQQAELGRAIYDRTCAACHGPDFEGSGDAP